MVDPTKDQIQVATASSGGRLSVDKTIAGRNQRT